MALTASSQASRLFKKSFGYGETSTLNEWFEELNYRGPEIVLSNQIWSESGLIPSTTPWPSGTVSGASAGVIQYFDKVSMTAVPGLNAGGKSFFLEDLKNSLGFSVADGSYGPKIFKSDNTSISFGSGNWLVDHSAGLLTFYPGDSGGALMPSGVNALNPPKISFYKYIGAIGVSASGGGSGTVYAGTGLTATGATLSVDFQSITGTGLTQNGSQISVDSTTLANSLAGNGLSASGGTLSVNFQSITGTGLTQNGSQISVDSTTLANSLAGDGLSASGGTLSVNVGNGLSIVSDTVVLGGTQTTNVNINSDSNDFTIGNFDTLTFTGSLVDIQSDTLFVVDAPSVDIYGGDIIIIASSSIDLVADNGTITTSNLEGLVYTSDYYSTFVTHSLIDKNYVDTQLSNLELDIILGVTAGAGLTGGGTSSDITLSLELDTLSGLTFSSAGDDGKLKVEVDNTTIQINGSGQLTVVAGASQPYYDSTTSLSTTGDNSSTGLTLTNTPNNYSRIQVFVNGQLQKLGNGSTTLDCYFSSDSGFTAKSLSSLSSGDVLYWNGLITKYDLNPQDEIMVVYEY